MKLNARKHPAALLLSLLLLSVCAALSAQTFSEVLSFQGRMADADTGKPLPDGQYDVTFTIYDAETDGNDLWQETQTVDQVGGVFNVYLGSVTAFPQGLFSDGDRWLALQVSGDPEMTERFQFTPAPWALYSASSGPDDDWAFSGDDIYNNNAGGVGIGTTSPASMLDVRSTEGVHGIMSEVPWIPVWAHRASTTGTFPAVHGECDSEAGGGSAVRGIMTSTSPGGYSAAVRGINNGTGGNGIGVYGSQDGSGWGVYGTAPSGIGVYGSSTSGTGVWGSGALQGGYFADSDDSGYARVGYSNHGIEAYGTDGGGYFADSDGTGDALVGDGDNGISAYGTHAGGLFKDTDNTGFTYVAYGDYGISAWGTGAGGYFRDTDSDGKAYVGYGTRGIEASGPGAGGYFEDTDSSAWAAVGSSAYKVVGNGTVSFVQNHPDDADNVIVYACPEGDEVATYTRGTARLVNGTARVPLGETFKWVTNPDIGLTAHLTPRGQWADLYIVSLTTEELVVASRDESSSAAFDYIVYGLRIGFEEVSIVQEKIREAFIPSMADHRALYERRPELRDFNALERFRRMRDAGGSSADVDLTASQELREKIVEFDPALHAVDVPVE